MDHLFCGACENLLPLAHVSNEVITCSICKSDTPISRITDVAIKYNIQRNMGWDYRKKYSTGIDQGSVELSNDQGSSIHGGATVKERCPKCQHPELQFYTLQLRSADEGQTVFFTCPKCQYKFNTNT
jgi:DNA-directed RNA polymerase I subunit RPA12